MKIVVIKSYELWILFLVLFDMKIMSLTRYKLQGEKRLQQKVTLLAVFYIIIIIVIIIIIIIIRHYS